MCRDSERPLTFETMLTDPMVRLMMDADGVSVHDLVATLAAAREAIAARERLAFLRATERGAAVHA
jgi:hypothetical protein